MIRIVRESGPKGFISVRALGHADYGARGKDVVCAAVSALLQAWLRNLMEVMGERLFVELDRKAGRMIFIVPQDIDDGLRIDVERLVKYFYPSIQSLSEQYPDHILVSEVLLTDDPICGMTSRNQG